MHRGGNDTVGTIDSNGLYRAPSVVPSPATVNVTAVSYDDAGRDCVGCRHDPSGPNRDGFSDILDNARGLANTKAFTATVTAQRRDRRVSTKVKWYVGNAGKRPGWEFDIRHDQFERRLQRSRDAADRLDRDRHGRLD